MAFSSYNAKLMVKKDGSTNWEQLCPIKGLPQIGGEPEQLETTTLDDSIQTFIDGIQQQESMSFVMNANKKVRGELNKLKGQELDLSIWLGNDGQGGEGKFTGKGKITYYINEAEVNAVVEMTLVVTPTAPFVEEESTQEG